LRRPGLPLAVLTSIIGKLAHIQGFVTLNGELVTMPMTVP
jgi:hypothetical protein